ncbi:MAG TPA: VCBS repeat-containing protein, partial [Planctomycetota bacterium]|nr:VCBS repeat-containing protein [Planctomycetota bacterium]
LAALAALAALLAAPGPAPPPTGLPAFTLQSVPVGLPPRLVEAGDLDGDADIDLVVLAQDEDATRTLVLRNHGAAGFGLWWQDEIGWQDNWGLDLELGDVDEDADLDLVLNVPFYGVAVRLNAGDATFDTLINVGDQGLNVDQELADMDDDGVLDIAHYELDLIGYVGARRGIGDGTFQLMNDLPLSPPIQSDLRIVLGDVSGDGLYDMLLAAQSGLHRVDGQSVQTWPFPIWDPPATLLAGGAFSDVVTGDLDGDGRLDVAATSRSASAVAVLLGLPGGGLAPPVFHPAGSLPAALAIADLDSDGVRDAAVLNRRGVLSVLLGTGQGGLASPISLQVGRQLSDVTAADLDGDGDIDLAVTDAVSGSVVLMWNQLVP